MNHHMHNLFPQAAPLPTVWADLALALEALLGGPPILAGGALRDHLNGRPVKDLDFFYPYDADMVGTVAGFFHAEGWTKTQEIGASCAELNEVVSVLGFSDPSGRFPEINVIFLDPEVAFDMESVAGRCDFGICQIAAMVGSAGQSWQFDYTTAFATDVSGRTFTLTRTGDEARSMRRWERLHEKYPEHRLVMP